ncbi:diacylglycerol/lipid kinase family protein [Streptococcus porcinus]|uniref:Transcriptional regulator n=2 Tax=Streptococcus porcinus TaxID=1340 RepID=A0A4V0HCZ3_STRPO|nr:diacylglycerol kinase family protein [Streptococcus porcinus]EGJ26811.1 lipid kinase, YegS/Rv2252/BmrU family [Streptococcus porcinus str. Jelinkova 176]SQG48622.1 transcriptional regulator [Streptococcus porcinus]VTT46892.1 transcriptional regulator [Streptococcus porcinus]VTT47911.1 transcriptional regulator [Streptococcus porcinus]
MKKVLLIVNPASGGEQAKEFEKEVRDKLTNHFDHVDTRYTEDIGDAKAFAREASEKHYDSVFVMGGDGTVNEAVNGIAEQGYVPKFGFLPLGTVNDLARALEIPLDPQKAIDRLNFEQTRSLDIGKVNDSYFTNIVAIGNIPASINNVDDKQKTLLGPMAYVISGMKEILGNKTYDFEMITPEKRKEIKGSLILVGLTNSVGGMDRFTSEAEVDDGFLHLVFTKDQTLLETLKALPTLLSKDDQTDDIVAYEKVKQVTITVKNEKLQTNVDGDQGDYLPVTLKVLPSHLQVYTCLS